MKLAIAIVVAFAAGVCARDTAQEWKDAAADGLRYEDCRCKPQIKGRELVASLCQAPTILGPWLHECIYRSHNPE